MATAPVPVKGKIERVEVKCNPDHVDKETVELSKSAGDQVAWHSVEHRIITFNGMSPFRESEFEIQPNATVLSGPIEVQANGSYKYTIHKPKGPVGVDPEIIIRY